MSGQGNEKIARRTDAAQFPRHPVLYRRESHTEQDNPMKNAAQRITRKFSGERMPKNPLVTLCAHIPSQPKSHIGI